MKRWRTGSRLHQRRLASICCNAVRIITTSFVLSKSTPPPPPTTRVYLVSDPNCGVQEDQRRICQEICQRCVTASHHTSPEFQAKDTVGEVDQRKRTKDEDLRWSVKNTAPVNILFTKDTCQTTTCTILTCEGTLILYQETRPWRILRCSHFRRKWWTLVWWCPEMPRICPWGLSSILRVVDCLGAELGSISQGCKTFQFISIREQKTNFYFIQTWVRGGCKSGSVLRIWLQKVSFKIIWLQGRLHTASSLVHDQDHHDCVFF